MHQYALNSVHGSPRYSEERLTDTARADRAGLGIKSLSSVYSFLTSLLFSSIYQSIESISIMSPITHATGIFDSHGWAE